MIKKILVIAFAIMLIGVTYSSYAEDNTWWVQRDYKNNKMKRLVSELYDKSKRTEAKKHLVSFGPEVLKHVLPLLNDEENESVRIAALYIIGKVGDSSVEEAVAEKLNDKSNKVRREAAKTLSIIRKSKKPVSYTKSKASWAKRDPQEYTAKRLVSQLYDRPTRAEARRSLASSGPEVVEYVVPLLKDKNNEFVQVAALYILSKTGDSSVEEEVIEKLRDRNHKVRQEAANTLGVIGTRKSIEPLKDLFNDHFPNVRFSALRALTRIAPKDETDLFISVLGDYDPRVRMYAIAALGKLRAKEAVPYLAQLTRDFDPGVRIAVVSALSRIGTKECVQPLTWLTGDPDLNVRLLAVKSLGELNIPDAEGPLVKAANSSDPRVAATAIIALGRRKSSKALEIAKKHLDDEYMGARIASIEVIGYLGGAGEKEALEPLLKAESALVRKKAKEALMEVNSRT
jgi:HEAT repeat protein